MRRLAIVTALLILGTTGVATAQTPTVPPGVSGADEYRETVPGSGGAVEGPVRGDGGGSDSTTGVSGVIPRPTADRLAADGNDGERARVLAERTAPTSEPSRGGEARDGDGPVSGSVAAGADEPKGPSASVVEAVTGSSSTGGMGALLLLVLLGSALATGLLLVLRRRRDAG